MKNIIGKILFLTFFILLLTSCQSSLQTNTLQDTLVPTLTPISTLCDEHVFSQWQKIKDETCQSKGEEIRDCTECGFIQTREISQSEFHSYVSTGECKLCGDKMDEGFRFELACDGKSYVFTYGGNAESVLVPATYNDKPVTEIGSHAFWHNSNVKKVKLSDNITKIGDRAFQFCTNLKSINPPKNLIEIGKEAFSNCQSLTSFKFPEGFKRIEASTFEGCHSLSVSLPDTIVYIGARAFYECTSIKNLKIPASVSSIGEAAFSSCRNLTTIEIEEGTKLTIIPKSAFSSGESLKKVVLPEGIVCIEKEAFSGHPHFEEIYLPSTLETVGDKAFYVVESFKVHFNGSESDWNEIEFGDKWIDALTTPTFDFKK